MKKIFTFLIAIATVTIASAQSYHQQDRSYNNNKQKQYAQNDRYDRNKFDNYKYDDRYEKRRYSERERQQEIARINRDYDKRIVVYRNDRRISQRERDRRIYQLNTERNQRLQSFGAGAAVGAIAGLVLGAIISH